MPVLSHFTKDPNYIFSCNYHDLNEFDATVLANIKQEPTSDDIRCELLADSSEEETTYVNEGEMYALEVTELVPSSDEEEFHLDRYEGITQSNIDGEQAMPFGFFRSPGTSKQCQSCQESGGWTENCRCFLTCSICYERGHVAATCPTVEHVQPLSEVEASESPPLAIISSVTGAKWSGSDPDEFSGDDDPARFNIGIL